MLSRPLLYQSIQVMKMSILGLLALLSLNLNAQQMKSPQNVVVQLFIATDQKEWDTAKDCFTETVLLDYSSMSGQPAAELSPEQIISSWKGILPGFESTHHQTGNYQVSRQDDTAHVFCYGTASHYLDDEEGSLWVVVGTYDFELAKVGNDTWKITSMKFNFKFQDGNTSLAEKAIGRSK